MHKKRVKVILAAGGTGGHLFPAQQLAFKLEEKNVEVLFAGYQLVTNTFFQRNRFPFVEIASGPLKAPHKLGKGLLQSITTLRKFKPDVVVGFGSYHCLPILVAAKFFPCKLILFEANTTLGRVISYMAPFADKLCMQFPCDKKWWFKPTGVHPLPWIAPSTLPEIKPEKKSILIFGGSQGAATFNQLFPEVASMLQTKGWKIKIIHIAGREKEKVEKNYKKNKVQAEVLSFTDSMAELYHKADMVIARAGAATIAELLYYEKPSLLIPYPYATKRHQEKNASFFAKKGCFHMLMQSDISKEKVIEEIETIFHKKRDAMKKAIQHYKTSKKQQDIIDIILRQ